MIFLNFFIKGINEKVFEKPCSTQEFLKIFLSVPLQRDNKSYGSLQKDSKNNLQLRRYFC